MKVILRENTFIEIALEINCNNEGICILCSISVVCECNQPNNTNERKIGDISKYRS